MIMSDRTSANTAESSNNDLRTSSAISQPASKLTRLAIWSHDHHVPFLVISIGMIVMLLWAGAFKMTARGAEGIIPLVSNSPLIWWHFKLFGPYIGADIIGSTEWLAAILIIVGYRRPKAGMVGSLITVLMFSITSSMLLSTPGTTISIHGIRYMDDLGLFLYKDVIALGASLYLFSYFGLRDIRGENRS